MNRFATSLTILLFFLSCTNQNIDKVDKTEIKKEQSDSQSFSTEDSVYIDSLILENTSSTTDSSDLMVLSEVRRIPLKWRNAGRYKIKNSSLRIMSDYTVQFHLTYNSEICAEDLHFDFKIVDRNTGKDLGEIYYKFFLQCRGPHKEVHLPDRVSVKDERILNLAIRRGESHPSRWKDCGQCR